MTDMSEDALKNMMVYTIACRLQKNVSEASCKSVNSGCYFDKVGIDFPRLICEMRAPLHFGGAFMTS